TLASQTAGRVRADLDPAALATILLSLALGVLMALEAGLPIDVDSARRTVVSLFTR
ncbi:MAG: hypothetical protein IT386_05610, partial [Deltaproteobacteria bacterium]|nr:hypothetical protein [Deltaproteobacteria bacterium]